MGLELYELLGNALCLSIFGSGKTSKYGEAQLQAGNRLEGARVVSSFHAPKNGKLFCYMLHVNVWIAKERRNKVNEFIFCRPDISSVLLYRGDKVVLVREFRSPVRNSEGFVYELPSGSSPEAKSNPLETASEEVYEETGLALEPSRFSQREVRQLYATLSTHVSTLFVAELTATELEHLQLDKTAHGVLEESERTYIEVWDLAEIRDQGLVDWSTLGMVLSVLGK